MVDWSIETKLGGESWKDVDFERSSSRQGDNEKRCQKKKVGRRCRFFVSNLFV